MLISIVIPCYRSVKTLPSVVAEVQSVFKKHLEHDYQLILVNDGSPDDTYKTICELSRKDPKILGIDLSRNFGQARARMAALPYVCGDCMVSMDDDGQHPVEGIFTLVSRIQDGFDVVYARFSHKKHSLFKQLTSKAFGKMMEVVGNRPKDIQISSFFALSRFAIDAQKKYQSPSPSLVAYLSQVTSRFTNVEMEHRERQIGRSGYTLGRMLNLAIVSLTNFTIIPLRAITLLGLLIAVCSFLSGVILVIRRLIYHNIAIGYTSQMTVMLLLGGIIIMILGLIGEYIGHIYMTISNLPQYMIRSAICCGNILQNENNEQDKKLKNH